MQGGRENGLKGGQPIKAQVFLPASGKRQIRIKISRPGVVRTPTHDLQREE
ncbi:MAG: hypothetical protein IH857_08295 [Deltaproteobacteria bacterium]|nr:hypothetical protein [Deltaproteobacteria bacterium]